MFDLITIGDGVIDTFVPLIEAKTRLIEGTQKLILPFGEKVPVGELISVVGGNAANNAIGAKRLKLKTAIYINIGNDHDGLKIRDGLKEEGIDQKYLVRANLQTNRHIVLDFKGERTILVYHQPWKYHLPELDNAKWVYLTSLSPSYIESDLYNQIISFLERSGAKLVYQPGTFQIKQGIKKSPRILSLTELFIVNLEEAKIILGFEESEKVAIKKLLEQLLSLGPKMVIITDGAEGSYGFDGEKYFKMGTFKSELVEATGAGDAFATGTLAGLFYGKNLGEAMRWGAANADSVIKKIGAQEGLLTHSQMLEKLKLNSKIIAKEI